MLAITKRDLRDRHFVGVLEGPLQQIEGLDADLFGLEVVGGFDVEAERHLVPFDELDDVDRPGGLERQLIEVLLVDEDELVLADLVALEHVVEGDDMIVRRAVPLLLDRKLAMGAELPE